MASIFTYDHEPPRVSSPWSTPGATTPQLASGGGKGVVIHCRTSAARESSSHVDDTDSLPDCGLTKLEAEPQQGPTEYKLHLLLRPRRTFSSLSTGHLACGSYQAPRPSRYLRECSSSEPALGQPPSTSTTTAIPQGRSSQSRQNRLQQLTTQLLWRLQQSSPFHSPSTVNMALPVLPEATPKLGVPNMPSRLLPGLEESQGALYEIGVSDDGTLVGLTEDELEESLVNLRAMAASLGCEVDILRKVVVGTCEWMEQATTGDGNESGIVVRTGKLWVAEALVKPDLDYYFSHSSSVEGRIGESNSNGDRPTTSSAETSNDSGQSSCTEQLHLAIIGPSAAGKSSLLGTLSTSAFDNGRGKSRLSLFKHRHEINSGLTSSVAQELIGYAPSRDTPSNSSVDVINYASEKVSAWNDIHQAAEDGRLAFVSDLPGLSRYLKSTLRGLVSWNPNYTILCVPANCYEENDPSRVQGNTDPASDIDTCVVYLELCFRLNLPVLITITKMDLASRSGLRETLSRILSVLKQAGRKPLILSASSEATGQDADLQTIISSDREEVDKYFPAVGGNPTLAVPIVLTSAVTGAGIGKVHALLRALPIPTRPSPRSESISHDQPVPTKLFDINEVFSMPPSKVYSVGRENGDERTGTGGMVLCGRVRSGQVSVGDILVVGPLLMDPRPADTTTQSRAFQGSESRRESTSHIRSYRSRPSSGEFSSSYVQDLLSGRYRSQVQPQACWLPMRTVSVRNLRLPVRTLLEGQIGTVGIEPISVDLPAGVRLDRIRKGMILADFPETPSGQPLTLPFHTGFAATFPTSDFSSPTSPPLILGGNPVVYIGSIRAAAKVTCVALAESDIMTSPSSPTEPDVFRFDGDDHRDGLHGQNGVGDMNGHVDVSNPEHAHRGKDITISFSFVSSIEWVEVGARILVIPGTAAASASGSTAGSTGLEGFVGKIREVFDGSEE